MTQPTLGPSYGVETVFVPFTPEQQRSLRGGLSTAKVKTFVPEGYELDHVGSGGMYLRRKITTSTQYRQYPTVAESDAKVAENKKKAAEAKAKVDEAYKTRHLWVDGVYVAVTQDDQGNWTTTPVGGKGSTTVPVPTAFSALDPTGVDEQSPFLMTHFQPGSTKTPLATGQKAVGVFGNIFGAVHSMATGAPGYMTIGNGVAWLASLATKDPGAYQAMLDKLHSANYLSDSDYASAGGHWSTEAGKAFALAARDVAVVNTTDGGRNTTLDEFLTSKQGALAAAQEAAKPKYEPVRRDYTDPTAIKAAAKSAAQELLGRRLTPEEENALVGHFRGLEDGMYDQIDSAGYAGKAATVTQPNPSGQIDDFLSTGPLEQEQANYDVAQYGGALRRLFGLGG